MKEADKIEHWPSYTAIQELLAKRFAVGLGMTAGELSSETGLHRTSVNRAIKHMADKGLVRRQGMKKTNGDTKATTIWVPVPGGAKPVEKKVGHFTAQIDELIEKLKSLREEAAKLDRKAETLKAAAQLVNEEV